LGVAQFIARFSWRYTFPLNFTISALPSYQRVSFPWLIFSVAIFFPVVKKTVRQRADKLKMQKAKSW